MTKDQLLKEVVVLSERIAELEAEKEAMKCCENCENDCESGYVPPECDLCITNETKENPFPNWQPKGVKQ